MARSNFKVFAESVANKDIQSDAVYNSDTQRVFGVVPGVAEPKMHNKLYKQSTVMAAAIAQVIVQAGFDALDSDYSGLVANLRKSFAGSVNGIKPDESGNIDLTALIEEIRQLTIPRIGDFIITRNPENPNKKYKNTTWELLESKTFVMSAGGDVSVNSRGGSNTHTNTIQEMPDHNHEGSIGYAGGHSHSRGSMNITGSFWGRDVQAGYNGNGAFFISAWGNYNDEGGKYHADYPSVMSFDASRAWTGETSFVENHNHSLFISSAGNGKTWDVRPKYIAAYIWIRTA